MTKKRKRRRGKSALDLQVALALRVVKAYQRHYGSATRREEAAADLGMDLQTFEAELDSARLLGLDIEATPKQGPAS